MATENNTLSKPALHGTKQSASLVPKLRFKEFEGEWESIKLGEITERIGDGLHGTPKYVEESDIFFINGNNLVNGNISLTNKTKKVDKSTFLKNDKKLGLNTLLISLNGTIGNISRFNNEKVMLGKSVGYFNFKTKSNFYYHILKSPKIQQFFISELTGSTIKNLSLTTLRKTKIDLPKFPEQQKIASFLTAVDTKIQQLKTKKETLVKFKKGAMQQLFSQQLRFKQDNGSDFEAWEEKKLGEVCDVRDGTHESPKYKSEGYPLITSKNLMKNGSIDFDIVNLISEKDFNDINKRSGVNVGDILFGMIGTIGNPVVVKEEGFAIKNVALIKEKVILKNFFLIHYLSSALILKQFYEQNTGGTQKFIALGVIRNLKILVPSIKEQEKIANYLSAIDTKIESVETQISNTQAFKKGLLQQMFV